jgi:hypothetical protein
VLVYFWTSRWVNQIKFHYCFFLRFKISLDDWLTNRKKANLKCTLLSFFFFLDP